MTTCKPDRFKKNRIDNAHRQWASDISSYHRFKNLRALSSTETTIAWCDRCMSEIRARYPGVKTSVWN